MPLNHIRREDIRKRRGGIELVVRHHVQRVYLLAHEAFPAGSRHGFLRRHTPFGKDSGVAERSLCRGRTRGDRLERIGNGAKRILSSWSAAVPLHEPFRIIVREPCVTFLVLPNQSLERQVNPIV
jgi:hypothetical protein